MNALLADPPYTDTLEATLDEARQRVEVNEPEIILAKEWRHDIVRVLRAEFPGSTIYFNGSVAHGDALTPLTDVDLGVIVPDPDRAYGPGAKGPTELQERTADALRAGLKDKHGEVYVYSTGRTRSVLVRFREPVFPGWEDFSADVIVAVDNPNDAGLYIPLYDRWDPADPQKHTTLIHAALDATDIAFARVVRLLKHWSRTHDKPLCSWHIKAIALQCITNPVGPIEGLTRWFDHAHDAVEAGPVADPAGVAKPIDVEDGTRADVLRALRLAHTGLVRAVEYERDGWHLLALKELADVFNDEEMLPSPDKDAVVEENARRMKAAAARVSSTTTATPVVSSWGE